MRVRVLHVRAYDNDIFVCVFFDPTGPVRSGEGSPRPPIGG